MQWWFILKLFILKIHALYIIVCESFLNCAPPIIKNTIFLMVNAMKNTQFWDVLNVFDCWCCTCSLMQRSTPSFSGLLLTPFSVISTLINRISTTRRLKVNECTQIVVRRSYGHGNATAVKRQYHPWQFRRIIFRGGGVRDVPGRRQGVKTVELR